MSKPIVFKIKGFRGFVGVLGNMEKVPQKCVNRAAGKGANIVRREIRSRAPVWTGDLKRGIVRNGERSRYKGKKVYDLMFDPAKNDIFQKPIKNRGEAGGKKHDHAYYPASMEYGFLTRSKGGGYSYVPGFYFMRKSAESKKPDVENTIIQELNKEIDGWWRIDER